jgi:hypothetical protein
MVAGEAVASTVAAASEERAAISAVAELDPVSVAAPVPAAQAVFAVARLAHTARTGQVGREPTAIDLMVRDPMVCTVEGARLHLVHVTGRRGGTELTQE